MADVRLLRSVHNHLVLPPKLPDEQDPDIEVVEDEILSRLRVACNKLAHIEDRRVTNIWSPIGRSLQLCYNLNQGRLERKTLSVAFSGLEPEIPLILYVVKQNAAVVVRRDVRYVTFPDLV